MRYRLVIRPDALADIEQAADWYDQQEQDLGSDFVSTVLATLDSLPANPLINQLRNRRRMCVGF